jgi:hypothetical protein
MLLSNSQFLDSSRFNRLIFDQSIRFLTEQSLIYLDRLPLVNADDDEIVATFSGQLYTADLIADDQRAVVVSAGTMQFTTTVIPNIKLGRRFGQNILNRLERLGRNNAGIQDVDYYGNWEVQNAAMLLRGIRERMNVLACGMMLDNINYNKFGVQINANWGIPSGLKVTPSTLWTSVTATPVTDILTLKVFAQTSYGVDFDRVTMSTADLINALSTTEVRTLIPGLVVGMGPLPANSFNARNPQMRRWFSELIGCEIEIDDKTYWVKNEDGTTTNAKVLPLGKVLMSRAQDDGNPASWDMANAVVTESIVARLMGEGLPGGQFGPIGYYTGNEDLNPPNLIAWGVARAFPRKHNKYVTAILTVQ